MKNAIPGGHTETDARFNDFGIILLGLFVPWVDLYEKVKHLNILDILVFYW